MLTVLSLLAVPETQGLPLVNTCFLAEPKHQHDSQLCTWTHPAPHKTGKNASRPGPASKGVAVSLALASSAQSY